MCGKTARVTCTRKSSFSFSTSLISRSTAVQGKTIQVQLTDRCGGCADGDLDFSPNAFNQLADPSVGRISGISWEIID